MSLAAEAEELLLAVCSQTLDARPEFAIQQCGVLNNRVTDKQRCEALGIRPGSTPLHIAIQNSDVVATDCLLRLGADPTIPDSDGLAPLDGLLLVHAPSHRAEAKRMQLANLLVAAGALRLQPESFAWRHDRHLLSASGSSALTDLVLARQRHQVMTGLERTKCRAGDASSCAMVPTSAVVGASAASLVTEEVARLLAMCRREGPRASAQTAAQALRLGDPEELWRCGKISGSPTRWMVLAFRVAYV